MASVSFAFPGWTFDGSGSSSPQGVDSTTSRTPSWLDDLNELDGGDEEEATGVESPPVGAPSAHAHGVMSYNDDVLHAIFSMLATATDLCAARATCSQWCSIASADDLWLTRWRAHERFSRLQQPRQPCAFRGSLAPPAPLHTAFSAYATACRANRSGLLRWMDLQKGWNRLETLLAPGATADEPEQAVSSLSPPQSTATVSPPPSSVSSRRRKRADCDGDDGEGGEGGEGDEGGSGVGGASSSSPASAGASSSWRDGLMLSAPARMQSRKLASILAARDWEQLHACVLYLQLEVAEQLARALAPRTNRGTYTQRDDASATSDAPGEVKGDDGGEVTRLACDAQVAVADEVLVVGLIHGWRRFKEWLSGLCGCFAHYAGSACRTHLICLLAAQRSNERVDQHTPSLLHAGFAAFRHAVLLHPTISRALSRHLQRAAHSVMGEGGYTVESAKLMQHLIDLQGVCSTVDAARDDHLCEERGERFTQEEMREVKQAGRV